MKLVVVAVLLSAQVARADESSAIQSVEYLEAAQVLARDGDCRGVLAIESRVQALDPEFHAKVFVRDVEIRGCTPHDGMKPRRDLRISGTAPGQNLPADRWPASPKSEGTALGLSVGTTLGGVAMLALASGGGESQGGLVAGGLLALAIGPTLGHAYAGNTWNTGLQVRLASAAFATLGAAIVVKSNCLFGAGCSDGAGALGGLMFTIGGVTYLGGTLYEMFTAGESAQKTNERFRLIPAVSSGPGVSVVGRF
jgi:hypothetical protein